MAYLTAAVVRATWLQGLVGTSEDTLIGTIIGRAEAAVARLLGYPGAAPTIESASYTRYSGDSGVFVVGRKLRLEPWPVTAVTSIYDDPDENWTSLYLVDPADYAVQSWGVMLKPGSAHGAWSEGAMSGQAVKATFTAGFATVPADIITATGMLVKHWWHLRTNQGFSSVPAGEASASLREETIPAAVRQLLAPYRLPSVLL